MKIAIDYDNTYTRDPNMWDAFICMARGSGHEVICVTNRPWPPGQTKAERVPYKCEIVAAGDQYKDAAAKEAGHVVHVWIDDMPGTVGPQLELP